MHSPLALLKVSLVLLLIPVFLLVHVLSNISKYMAPNFTFKIVMRILEKVKVRYWPNAEKIQGVEDMDFFFSMDIKKFFVESAIEDILKPAKLGSEAPNPMMVNLSNTVSTPLLSMAKPGRPFILNFGSCT